MAHLQVDDIVVVWPLGRASPWTARISGFQKKDGESWPVVVDRDGDTFHVCPLLVTHGDERIHDALRWALTGSC